VVRGKLGVTIASVNEDVRKLLKLKDRSGALVNTVEAGGPADKAGLKRYDVVTGINGQPVKDNNDLRFKIADVEPGKKVQLNIIRDGKEITLAATTEELDPQEDKAAPESASKDIGLSVTRMNPNLARRYGFRTTEGLLITEVKNFSAAAKAGLEAGDLILEINRAKVDQVSDLDNALRNTKSGDAIMLLIRRESDGDTQDSIVIVKVP
jgi:serine protease Do